MLPDDLDPAVLELATLGSLATRIEPQLLRTLRVNLAPHLRSGTEADFWFSPLVAARASTGVVLSAEFVQPLRDALAIDRNRLDGAWRITERAHRDGSPVLLAEEELAWLSARGLTAADENERARGLLRRLVATLIDENQSEMVNWAGRAVLRLPANVFKFEEASFLALAANYRGADVATAIEKSPFGRWAEVPWLMPKGAPGRVVGVRLVVGGVEFGPPTLEGAHALRLPPGRDLSVLVGFDEPNGWRETRVRINPEKTKFVPFEGDECRIAVPAGPAYRLRYDTSNGKLRNSGAQTLAQFAQGVRKLSAYKTLHDILQRVQLEHYGFIVAEIKKLGEDSTVRDVLGIHISALQRLCADARMAADAWGDSEASFGAERAWVSTLSSAVNDLDAAVERFDVRSARGATLIIRQILGQEPARLDHEMRRTTESLSVEELISTLAERKSIRGLQAKRERELDLAMANLESLWSNLRGRMAIHNRWQNVENQLWVADQEFERTSPDISEDFLALWEKSKLGITILWDLDPSAEWTTKTRRYVNEVDALLNATAVDVRAVQRRYNRFRTDARYQFFEVDMSLKSFCDQMLGLGPMLASLLDG